MGKIFADFDVEQQETARLRRRQNSIRNAMQNCWLSGASGKSGILKVW